MSLLTIMTLVLVVCYLVLSVIIYSDLKEENEDARD